MHGRSLRHALGPVLTAVLLAGGAWTAGLVSPGQSSAAARLAPLPPAVPGEGGYSFMITHDDGRPATFDPCRPVHWVIRPDGAPTGSERMVREAVEQIARSTGLRMVYDGHTDEAPSEPRPRSQPERYGSRPAPVLVAWSTAAETPGLAGPQVGLGVASWAGGRLVSGQVLLDRHDLTAPDGGPDVLTASTVLHELAHVVGLGHVDDPEQLMHDTVLGEPAFGDGDLRGLRAVGSGPCS